MSLAKICIIGGAPSSRLLAPFQDKDVKIWVTSPSNSDVFAKAGYLKRIDRWFEVHAVDAWAADEPGWLEWLNKQSFEIYMDRENEWVPRAKGIPWQSLVEKFGRFFFTSAVAWMLAMAIDELMPHAAEARETGGPKPVLYVYGIDMSAGGEYEYQRPGCHYFFQVAEAAGIELSIPFESDIHRPPPLYGISWSLPMHRKMEERQKEIDERLKRAKADQARAQYEVAFCTGASDNMAYVRRTWIGP